MLIRKTKGNTSNKTDGAFNIVTYRGKNKLEFVFLKKLISSNKFNIIIKDKKKILIFKYRHGYGIEIIKSVALEIEPNTHNKFYLKTKRDKMGHSFKNLDE